MWVALDRSGELEALSAILHQAYAQADVGTILVLAADGNGWDAAALDPIVQATSKPIFGGIFPQ